MAEMRTEEEQVQAIKDWWKKNGSSLLIGIAAALAIVFGWQAWQDHQAQQRTEAANQFGNLLNTFTGEDTEDKGETINYLASQLREDFADSAYAIYGSLILARYQLMDEEDAAAAADSLTWAMNKTEEGHPLRLIVLNRLARAQFTAGNHDEALATLDQAGDTGSFTAIFQELRGDILLASGDTEGAREAYIAARDATELGQRVGILELKLADLGVGEGA
jgi:predicted negative regulator of RcsB-dependent stress response